MKSLIKNIKNNKKKNKDLKNKVIEKKKILNLLKLLEKLISMEEILTISHPALIKIVMKITIDSNELIKNKVFVYLCYLLNSYFYIYHNFSLQLGKQNFIINYQNTFLNPFFNISIKQQTMVKIHTLTHDPQSSVIRTPLAEHSFSRARQYQRAFNAVKLNKLFAKPLIGTLEGHSDGISVLQKCTLSLNKMISGAHDGQIKIWDLSQRKSLISIYDHTMSVKGVSFNKDGTKFLSSSADKTINLYSFKAMLQSQQQQMHKSFSMYQKKLNKKIQPITKYLSKYVTNNVDHSPTQLQFTTSGDLVQVWSYERSKPIYQLQWNVDSILKVKYNPSEHNILLGSCSDRSLILYDLRAQTPVQKITLPNKSSCMAFNPLQPINFVVGNDDSNCYTFDLRRMDKAKTIHKDHVGAVTDIDFSPTGRQFVTGSFDRTVRIFKHDEGRSRQVYHTKRMQIVSSVSYTMDGTYVLSGSEDMNIRLWKNVSYKPTGVVNQRQSRAIEYRQKLVQKFIHTNKIRRIHNHRHLPKYILNAKKRRQDQAQSKFNKRVNKQANTGIKQQPINLKQKAVQNIAFQQEKIQRRKKNKSQRNQAQNFNQEQYYQQQNNRMHEQQ